jgi:hypothetical protein
MNKYSIAFATAFLLASLFFKATNSFAQTEKHVLGIQAGVLNYEGDLERLSYSGGLFYDHKLNHRFGVNLAALYRQYSKKGSFLSISESTPDLPIEKFIIHYLEVPVNLSINLNKRPEASWKTNLLLGGTYIYLLGIREKDFDGNKASAINKRLSKEYLYSNLGVEVTHKLSDKYLIGINPGLRVGVFDAYPDSDLYALLKFGRTF